MEGNPAPAPWRDGTAKSGGKKAKGKRQEVRAGRLCLALLSAPQSFGVDSLDVSDPKLTDLIPLLLMQSKCNGVVSQNQAPPESRMLPPSRLQWKRHGARRKKPRSPSFFAINSQFFFEFTVLMLRDRFKRNSSPALDRCNFVLLHADSLRKTATRSGNRSGNRNGNRSGKKR